MCVFSVIMVFLAVNRLLRNVLLVTEKNQIANFFLEFQNGSYHSEVESPFRTV